MQEITDRNGLEARSDYLLQWLDAGVGVDDTRSFAHNGASARDEDVQGFAARLYQLCLHALQDLYIREREKRKFGSQTTGLRECLGRLYLWGESFERGELDRALEESDEVRESVLERLGHIGELLLRATTIAAPQGLPQPSKQSIDLELLVKQTRDVISSYREEEPPIGDDSDEEYDSERESLSDSERYSLCEDVSFSITCLAELRPSLDLNLVRAEKNRTQSARPPPVSFYLSDPAKIYVSLVREKFKQAQDQLVERLGEANWQRHIGVRRRAESKTGMIKEVPELSCSIFRPYSTFHDSGIGTSVPAQTAYTPSHTSYISSNTEGERNSLRVPPMPSEVGAGNPFKCEFCGMILSSIKNRVDWKLHVFADLQPYICTFANCEDELAQFPTRAAWSDHEFAEHRITQQWICPECPKTSTRTIDWEDHLQRDHQCVFTGSKLQVAFRMALHKQCRAAENEECPLCRTIPGKPRRAFIKHIGRHMEEIALMALPRNTEDESDEGSTSSNEESMPAVDTEMVSGTPGREDMAGRKERFYAAAQRVLDILRGYTEHSTPFLTPVDSQEVPDYYDIIKEPMDLTTVKDRLENYWYSSKDAFLSDLNRIWNNCLRYHTASDHPLRGKALAMHQKTREIMPLIPNIIIGEGTDVNAEERQLQYSDTHAYDEEDDNDESIMSSRGCLTLGSENKSSLDRSVPANPQPLPRIGENQDVPWEGSSSASKDNITGAKVNLGELRNVTKAGKPRKHPSSACNACRQRKMNCDIAKPKCSSCEESGDECIFPPARPGERTQPSPGPNDLRHTYPFASSHNNSGAYETPAQGAATNRVPVSSLLADSSTALQQSKVAVDGSIPPTNKEHRCPYCSTSFNRHHNLKSHLLTHNQDKAYACGTCEARFRRSHDLKRHTKLHTGKIYTSIHDYADTLARWQREHSINKNINARGERRGSEGDIDNVLSAKKLPLPRSKEDVDDVDVGLKPQIQMPPRVAPTDLWVGSGWSSENDKTLLRTRKEGLDWPTIVSQYFPESTANAIRNQHTASLANNEIDTEKSLIHEFPFTQQQKSNAQPQASHSHATELENSPPPEHRLTQEHTVSSQPYFSSLDGPTTVSANDLLLNQQFVQGEKGIFNEESTSYKGKRLYGDDDEQRHPSLTRERHPIYGNSLFSENHSVYRADDANDPITDLLFEHQVAKGSILPTYSDPSGGSKRRAARSVSLETRNDLTPSQRPSHTTTAATSGSAYKINDSTYGGKVEEPQSSPKIFECSHPDCVEKPPSFSRKSEWKKHMDKHTRPYVCEVPACDHLHGFTSSGGPTGPYTCLYNPCGLKYTREGNCKDHMRRVHGWDGPKIVRSERIVRGEDGLEEQSVRSELQSGKSRVFKDVSEGVSDKKSIEPIERENELEEADTQDDARFVVRPVENNAPGRKKVIRLYDDVYVKSP